MADAVHVVHLLNGARPGGVESFVVSLAREIDRTRFSLTALLTGGEGSVTAQLREAGVDVVALRGTPSSLGDWMVFSRVIHRRRGAILHTHLGGRAVRIASRMAGCGPIVVHLHGEPDEIAPDLHRNPASVRKPVKNLISGTDRVLACSESLVNVLSGALPEFRSRAELIRYGVRIADYGGASVGVRAGSLQRDLRIPAEATVIGFVGRLVPQKGIGDLATIARAVLEHRPDTHVVVAGDGPLRHILTDMASSIDAGRFHMLGWWDDVPALLAAVDLLVVPSAWEAFGIVCLEAMAARRPVAAYGVGGIPESVVDDATGLLAPSGDCSALIARVLRLIDDRALRTRLGEAGRRQVEERFDARFPARQLERIYTSLMPAARDTT